jgi:hypothetical protein
MTKKRVEPIERNRVNVSFSNRDYETLSKRAKEEQLPITTYARLLILRQMALAASPALRSGSKG